jgi:NAD(P)-dependent dehydrogenase (short-subunit alcohol dehydrogenase family)
MLDKLRYDGQRVIVTGAASGMGEAVARIVGELGGEVFALDVKEPKVAFAKYIDTDLRDPASIDAAVETIGEPVHKLFNCAGLPNLFPALDVMLVNFVGARHLIGRVLRVMPPRSAIASISSVGGMGWARMLGSINELLTVGGFDDARRWCEEHPDAVGDGYSFSKQCIIVNTMASAGELIGKGIRINCISPGPTTTPMYPQFVEAMGQDFWDAWPRPMGRDASPDEQAHALVFLNSDAASFITGTNLFTDGGFTGAAFTGQIDMTKLGRKG